MEKVRNWWDLSANFLREVRVEFRKVTWPSRLELRGSTLAVLVSVFVIAVYLGLSDLALSELLALVFG